MDLSQKVHKLDISRLNCVPLANSRKEDTSFDDGGPCGGNACLNEAVCSFQRLGGLRPNSPGLIERLSDIEHVSVGPYKLLPRIG